MSGAGTPAAIGPGAYATWRGTALGAVTEAIEQRLVLALLGDVRGALVLDVGCGDGLLACALAARGARVVGVDPDPAMLEAARERAGAGAVHVAHAVPAACGGTDKGRGLPGRQGA